MMKHWEDQGRRDVELKESDKVLIKLNKESFKPLEGNDVLQLALDVSMSLQYYWEYGRDYI